MINAFCPRNFLIIILILEVDAYKSLVHTHVQTHVEPASMLTEVLGKSGSCLDDHFGDVVGENFGQLAITPLKTLLIK